MISIEPQKFLRMLRGCLCIAIACLFGAITVFWVGHMIYEATFEKAIAAGAFVTDPLAGAENFGESLGFLATSFMYLVGGAIAGIVTGAQFLRFSRRWSPHNRWHIIGVSLLNAVTTDIGTGALLGILTVCAAYPHLRSPTWPDGDYLITINVILILGLAFLSVNFVLPRWVRSLSSR